MRIENYIHLYSPPGFDRTRLLSFKTSRPSPVVRERRDFEKA